MTLLPTRPPSIQNILIVRLSAIGDVTHVLPCLHALREAYPKARIGWIVEELSAPLLRGHPEIDDLFVIPKKRWRAHPILTFFNGEKRRFYREVRRVKWDAAIDFQGLTKSGLPAWLSGSRLRVGYGDTNGREFNKLFTNHRVTPASSAVHVIQKNMSLLGPLGIRDAKVAWRFPTWVQEDKDLEPFFEGAAFRGGRAFMAINPGAGWETKRWPVGHFAALVRQLADGEATRLLPMVLIWGPGEEALCREIMAAAALPESRLLMAPRTNLPQLAALLAKASLMIGGDTGPVHLAAALGVPVVGIYGGSDPERNGPWGERNIALLPDASECRLCWRTRCNHQDPMQCMKSISPDTVAQAVCAILGRQ